MTDQKKFYTATDTIYKEYLSRMLNVENEIKELKLNKKEIISEGATKGCNPKILRQMERLAKMNQDEQQALQDALEMA